MPILQSDLIRRGTFTVARKSETVVEEARVVNKPTAFLSHSHSDAPLAKGVQDFLHSNGWEVYIDWDDTSMPSSPTRETAEKIQRKIRELDWFLFLATANSMASRWCPWELGYADGKKSHEAILIMSTRDNAGRDHGSEYLQLYKRLEPAQAGGIGAFAANSTRGFLLEGTARP